jgi:hypothetical protein
MRFLLKYGPTREPAWERTYGTPVNQQTGFDDEFAAGLAVASDDSVYVTGQLGTGVRFLAKLSPDGERDWGVDGVQAPFTGLTAAYGAATDGDGNVYITGNTFDSGHPKNVILVKFNAVGDLIWQKVGGPGFGTGLDVAVSPDHTAVFVSGNIVADDPDVFGGHASSRSSQPPARRRRQIPGAGVLKTARAQSL